MSESHRHAAVFEAAMRGEADDWEVNCSNWNKDYWRPAVDFLDNIYIFKDRWTSRRKQKTHVVNGFTVPEPLTITPSTSERYFIESPADKGYFAEYVANDDFVDSRVLSRGIAHATKEGAIANCKARLGIDPYKDES